MLLKPYMLKKLGIYIYGQTFALFFLIPACMRSNTFPANMGTELIYIDNPIVAEFGNIKRIFYTICPTCRLLE